MRQATFALGSVQWGLDYGIANKTGQPGPEVVQAILDRAFDSGVRIVDSARAYGSSEEVLGSLAASSRFRVVTKVISPLSVDQPEHARKELQTSIAASLEALRLTQLDTVLFHRGSHATCQQGLLWNELARFRDQGKIERIGVSAANPEEAWSALELEGIEVMQVATSLLDRRLYAKGFFEAAKARGIEVFVRSVYLQGVAHLAVADLPPHLSPLGPVLQQLDAFVKELGMARWELFLAWARQRLAGTVVLGTETVAQLEANIRAWECELPEVVLARCEALAHLDDCRVLDPSQWR